MVFFKCLEVNSSGTHSSSNSAVPEENKAADNRLCTTRYLTATAAFSKKSIKLSERVEITEGSGTEATPYSSWHNRSGGHWFGLKDKGSHLGRKQESGNCHHFSVSLTRRDTLATLLLQCLAEGEKSPMALLLPCQQRTTTAPGKKPQPLPTVHNTESSASEKAELRRRLPSRSRKMQPHKAEQPASQRSQNLHESSRSCIWEKSWVIPAGIVATVEKVNKLSQLSL